jgi:hypothetical protein
LILLNRSKLVLPHHLTMATAASGTTIFCERTLRRALIVVAVLGLAAGLFARIAGDRDVADLVWSAATVPIAAFLLVSIVRDLMAGRMGVDAFAMIASASIGPAITSTR